MDGRTTDRPSGRLDRGTLLRLLLSCALAGALLATGASYASYSSSDGAEDGARVAAGLVEVKYDKTEDADANGNPKIALVRPSNDGVLAKSFGFSVSNGTGSASEVAIEYDIAVTLEEPETLPNGVTIRLMREDRILDSLSGSGQDRTLAASESFEPGKTDEHEYAIVFEGNFDAISPETDTSDYFNITVKAEQVD